MRLAGTTAALTLAATLSAACAGGQTRIYVAPTSETIEAHTEITLSGDGQEVYVLNHSSVPIIVTGLSLVNCENIKNRCEAERLHVRVPPGQRVSLVTVRLNKYQPAFVVQLSVHVGTRQGAIDCLAAAEHAPEADGARRLW